MQISTFRQLLRFFSDNPEDIDFSAGKLMMQVRDDIIEAELTYRDYDVYVDDGGGALPAEKWIVARLAKLPILADRLISSIGCDENYVEASGDYLDSVNINPSNTVKHIDEVANYLVERIDSPIVAATNVIYVTSDAGEGKTTLINHIARLQAEKFKNKKSDYLILPVSLGGRPFVRFDDVVVGTLTNKFRFPYLYFDSVIELVRMGALVLALDGFEEMFIESSSGKDAISALGSLVGELKSQGSLIIAARKAYFEFKDINNQFQLFDTFCDNDVEFSKLSLSRWSRKQFIEYGLSRKIENVDTLYDLLVAKLKSNDHPLISRAVLVKRLFTVIKETSIDSIIDKLSIDTEDYFRQFIDVLIEREAIEKWIDKTGDAAKPLISVSDHYFILSLIAEEMWLNSTDSLSAPVFNMISEMACDALGKDSNISRQVSERIIQHALIVKSDKKGDFGFDHDEFKYFFLGDRIASLIAENSTADIKAVFRKSSMPDMVFQVIALALQSREVEPLNAVKDLVRTATSEGGTSYIKENCSSLITHLLNGIDGNGIVLESLYYPSDSFSGKVLDNITFRKCVFYDIDMCSLTLRNIIFDDCTIDKFHISVNSIVDSVVFRSLAPKSIFNIDSEKSWFNPRSIVENLCSVGINVEIDNGCHNDIEVSNEEDDRITICKKAVRAFMRSTTVTDEVFRIRLGLDGARFMDDILPDLLSCNVIEELRYKGSGKTRIYKMSIKMTAFQKSMMLSVGEYDKFIAHLHDLR